MSNRTPAPRGARAWAFAVLVAAPLLPGCGLFKKILARPKVEEAKVRFVKATFDEAEVEFRFTLYNPNSIGATLYKVDYALEAGGHRIAYGETPPDRRTDLPAKGRAEVVLPVTVPYAELRSALRAVFGDDEFPYRFSGGILVLEPAFGGIRIPIEKKGTLPSLKPPRVIFGGIRLEAVSLDKVRLSVALAVENRAKMPLVLKKFNGSLALNGMSVATIPELRIDRGVEGEKMTRVEIPLEISPLALGLEARRILKERRVRYAFSGDAEFEVHKAGPVHKALEFKGETDLKKDP